MKKKKYNLVTHSGFKPGDRAGAVIHNVIDAFISLKLIPKAEIALSVSSFTPAKMRALNKKHRGKDKPTDVLSFEQDFNHSPKGFIFLGDIVICMDVAEKQAKENAHSLRTEFTILLIHGMLHLLGYDHEKSKKDAKEMAMLEMKILKKLDLKPSGLITR